MLYSFYAFFFFNDTATTDIYTLSLHDALPICSVTVCLKSRAGASMKTTQRYGTGIRRSGEIGSRKQSASGGGSTTDRKSTRLNSSHVEISYAVFCLKKKKKKKKQRIKKETMTK